MNPQVSDERDGLSHFKLGAGQHTHYSFSKSLNTKVRQVFLPVRVGNAKSTWSILVNLPLDKIDAPRRDLTKFTVIGGTTLLIVLLISLWAACRQIIGNPLRRTVEVIDALRDRRFDITVPDQNRADEVGAISRALQVFKENGLEMQRMEAEAAEQKAQAEADRKAALLKMAGSFESSVKGIVDVVATSSTEMEAAAQALSATAEQTSQQASAVATAADQASANVNTVAGATEELSASIQEIARQVSSSASVARQAVEEAERTGSIVKELVEAAQQIGDVVNLINSIASQTNLLALNATIEAARAGEAGKGFAVVASEVKTLASQTGRATDEIGAKIQEIQNVTGTAVRSIESITSTIAKMSEISATIASAVEEQQAATRDIAGNVAQAAHGTAEVSSNISGVTQAAGETGAAASQVLSAAGGLSREAERLRDEVTTFLDTVRAA